MPASALSAPPHLERCLAYAVLREPAHWLGSSSPEALSIFLAGAATRADFVSPALARWDIYGPLELPEFFLPLVARTGHPLLTVKWSGALELLYFNLDEAMDHLRGLVEAWPAPPPASGPVQPLRSPLEPDLRTHLRRLARRPAMVLGEARGSLLGHYLAGMKRGGDWLRLPDLPELDSLLGGIEACSEQSYGSPFAAFRVYDHSPATLLSWVGVEPLDD